MKSLFIIILLGMLIISCKDNIPVTPMCVSLDSIQCETLRMTIINDPYETNWDKSFKGNFWTPTTSQMKIIDSIAVWGIQDNRDENNELLYKISLNQFYRQYVLYVNREKDSMVFINAFCEKLEMHDIESNKLISFDWQHKILHVDDGGDCYWRIWINFSKKRYTKFMSNN